VEQSKTRSISRRKGASCAAQHVGGIIVEWGSRARWHLSSC